MDRLTMTSDKGGLAFTFDLDFRSQPSEARKILALGERLKAYEDAEEQRNKGCNFCNGHEHYHFYAGYSQQLDVDKFDEREIEEINFCPICGRALKGGE